MRFARAVLGRPATFTVIFLVANVFLFVLLALSGGAENIATSIGYGAKVNSLIDRGEWWRFVTPIFLHGGILHLLFNMYGLWVIGPYVEKLYGSGKFVVFWVVTGIAGVVASYLSVRPDMHVSSIGRFLFKAEDTPSVGASGALFGLVGVLFVFGIRFRHELPDGFKRAFGTGMIPIIVINLFIGFLGRGFIDNAAHLGGLLSGAMLALVVGYKRPGSRGSITIFWHVFQAGALALVLVSFFMVWRHYDGPKLSWSIASLTPGVSGNRDAVTGYLKAVNDGTKAFRKALYDGDTSEIDAAIKTIDSAPSLDPKADELRLELRALLERVRDLDQRNDDQRPSAAEVQLSKDFQTWEDKNKSWVAADGKKYGLKLIEDAEPATSPAK
jgi:membrane associated rhomboid family serine protease